MLDLEKFAPLNLEDVMSMPSILAFSNLAFAKSTESALASVMTALVPHAFKKCARSSVAFTRLVRSRTAFSSFAPVKLALVNTALVKSAPVKSAFVKSAFVKSASIKLMLFILAPQRFASLATMRCMSAPSSCAW